MSDEIKDKALRDGVPIIKDEGLAFLLETIERYGYRQILELGTAVGYSAMAMARLRKDIHVDTIEKNEEMYLQAQENIRNEGLEGQIELFFMPIEDFHTDKRYDLIFVDAAKAQYGKYLEMFVGNLEDGGRFFFDNMVFHGLIYEQESIASRSLRSLVRKINAFREQVHNDERFDIIFYDNIGDGILLLSRRKN